MKKSTNRPLIIRCRNCGTPSPSHLQVCATCGANLEPKSFPVFRLSMGVIAVMILYFGYTQLTPIVAQTSQEVANLINPPTETPTPTSTHTPTLMPTPSPTSTPTQTATGTPTHTPSPTTSPTPSLAPTNTTTPTSTATPAGPTHTPAPPTPTPTPTLRFESIAIIGPEKGEHFEREKQVVLEWEPIGPLGKDEWYAVRMTWTQEGEAAYGGTNTRDTFWVVPPERYYGLADLETSRAYEWHVFVEKAVLDETSNTTVNRPISARSETRTFYWE